ncbi:MAG TPA: acyl-CoA synthetase [Vicinamibacterales bacterium]|jgi:malonyl-CoA/methylmalonyl-CoA synthetase
MRWILPDEPLPVNGQWHNGRIDTDPLAIVAADGVFTYHDLAESAARVAAGLLDGAPDLQDARVAYLVPPSFGHVAVSRGIWQAGGVAVPLAVSHPEAELEYVVRDAGASIVVASGRLAESLRAVSARAGARFLDTHDLLAGLDVPEPRQQPEPPRQARRALIVYTSGTTGRPKGVVTTHGQIAAQIASLLDAWGWTAADRALLVLPLHHVHGIINVLGSALAAGAVCEIPPQFDPFGTWQRLAEGEVTVFSAVPTIYHRLIAAWEAASPAQQRRWSDGSRQLRLMMSGSAALPLRTLDRWRAITGHTLLERYGMTETGMILSNPLRGERRPGAVGTPLPGVEVRLADDEIEVRGPGVFSEYWQRPEETEAAFRDGWFRTGDVAVLEHGVYRLLGRRSTDILKTGGFKVSALEIEDVLREHPAVADAAVVGAPDDEWGQRVIAVVELQPGTTLRLDEMREWLKPRLAPYKIPRELRAVEALPRNAMGKVNKPALGKEPGGDGEGC